MLVIIAKHILMKKSILIIITFLLGAFSALGQSYVSFEHPPKMHLTPQNEYGNYKIKYRAVKKSTVYLELKKGDLIVASGVLDIPKPSEKVANMVIKVKAPHALPHGQNYSYNLYMYSGGRNDWSRKACKSVSIKGVRMGGKKQIEKSKGMMSLRNFFD